MLSAAAAAGALAIGALSIALFRTRRSTEPRRPPSDNRARLNHVQATGAARALVRLRLAKLTPKLLRDRLAQLRWAIIAETKGDGRWVQSTTFTIIRDGAGQGALVLYHCENEGTAAAVTRGVFPSVVRDGNVVLVVAHGSTLSRTVIDELGY